MRDRRPGAGWFRLLMVLVLLFGQQAAIAHLCARVLPMSAPGAPVDRKDHGVAGNPAPAPAATQAPCEGHGAGAAEGAAPEDRLLCKAHCQADEQSVNSGSAAPDLPAAVLLGLVPWHQPRLGDAAPGGRPAPRATPTGPPAGSPPLYLSLLVLRN